MGIQHNHYADPTNKVGCDQWNDEHKIVNMLGYELVEEKILPAGTTTTTFSGLNGDEDEEYLIEGEISIAAGGADRYLNLLPNNISTNQTGARSFAYQGSYYSGDTMSSLILAMNGWSTDSTNWFIAKLKAKTGKNRQYRCDDVAAMTSRDGGQVFRAVWRDTTTNITTLVITISGGSYSGKIQLWKRIPLSG